MFFGDEGENVFLEKIMVSAIVPYDQAFIIHVCNILVSAIVPYDQAFIIHVCNDVAPGCLFIGYYWDLPSKPSRDPNVMPSGFY
jgi:hypothetical protein